MSTKTIAILGAGPIGLEAAIYARTLGHSVSVYERGQVGANIGLWGFVRLFSPWSMNMSPLGFKLLGQAPPMDQCPTGAEFRERYLVPLARSPLLHGAIHTDSTVLAVGKENYFKADQIGKPQRASAPFRILKRDVDGRESIERADVLLDCTGTYTNHRFAGHGGIPAPGELSLRDRIHYTIPDVLGKHRSEFADRHTLIIGSGYSAATVLRGLAELASEHPQTRVTWAIRRPGQALHNVLNDPLVERQRLVETMLRLTQQPPPWLQFLGTAVLESISADRREFAVTLRSSGVDLALTADNVVSLVGYRPDSSIYEQLQVHQCYATSGPIKLAAALLGSDAGDCLAAGQNLTADVLKNPEPSFFILGSKSYGTSSTFLMQAGHRQVRDAFSLIEGNPELDLYR